MASYSYSVSTPSTVAVAPEGVMERENQRLFGTDIRFDNDFFINSKGDYQLIEGFENLRQAVRRRLLTRPGEYKFVPDYGVGVQLYLKKPRSPSRKSELQNAIKSNLLRDPRIQEVVQVEIEDIVDGIKVGIVIRAAGKALLFKPFTFTKDL